MRILSLAAAGISFVGVAGTTLLVWRMVEKRLRSGFIRRRFHLDRRRSGTLLRGGWLESLTSEVLAPLGRLAAPRGEEELAAGYYLPAAVLRRQASARSRKIRQELPDVLDLLKICIEAGLSLDSALFRVGRDLKDIAPVLSRELAQYFLEIQSGLPRKEVLSSLAERNQVNALSGVVNVLIQSSRLGTDIAEALEVYSASLRTERMQAAQEQGAKVSTKLTFPMIFLILPALLIVILGPAMINMLDRLSRLF